MTSPVGRDGGGDGKEDRMIVTTTPGIDGMRITRYCGVVAGEAILGANVFKDLFAGIRTWSAVGPRRTSGNCSEPVTSP